MTLKYTETVIEYYSKFIDEILSGQIVYAIKGENGFPLQESNMDGESRKIMLFWGDERRAKVYRNANYGDHEIIKIEVARYIAAWLPGMKKDDCLVGPNWDKDGFGIEIDPKDMLNKIKTLLG